MIFIVLLIVGQITGDDDRSFSIHRYEHERHRLAAAYSAVSEKPVAGLPGLANENRGLLKNYYGYMPYWIDTVYYQYLQMYLLTHIAYFSVDIDPATGNLSGIPNASRFNCLYGLGHAYGVHLHMTFTLFGSANVTAFLNNASARANAISGISAMMTNYFLEGANIDFEFVTSSVRDSFNNFVADLYAVLVSNPGGRKELYLAAPAVPEWYPGYDLVYLSAHTDGLFIMAYDYHWTGSANAGPVSPCVPSSFWGVYCAAKSIGSYKAAGVPGARIVLGIPYYGIDWPTVSGDMGAATTGAGSAVIYYNAYQNASTNGRLWDNYSMIPWYRYSSGGWHQCWYDDSVSLDIKFRMANDSLLQGAGCWALGYDRNYDHIWNAIRRNFWVEPPRQHWTVEVHIDSLNVRDGPGTSYRILTTSRLGSRFAAFDFNGTWYKVYFPAQAGPYYAWLAGGDGIVSQFLQGATGQMLLRVTASQLNVREGPGTSYPVITVLAEGQVFTADSVSGDWARIFLPWITGHAAGWINHNYTIRITNPEDYNSYDGAVLETTYPAVVIEGDTFSVTMRIHNTGFGPFDSLLSLTSSGRSPFYYPDRWRDTMHAQLFGFWGLPNQVFYNRAVFLAPDVTNTTTVADTFRFERRSSVFGSQVIVALTVNPRGIEEHAGRPLPAAALLPGIFRSSFIVTPLETGALHVMFVYDAAGCRRRSYRFRTPVRIGQDLAPGVYFYVIQGPNRQAQGKMIKVD